MNLHHETYWHLTNENSEMLHNAFIGRGVVFSASAVAIGSLSGIVTHYASLHQDVEKEALFEEIRQHHYPDRPSRMKALFCFTSKADAECAAIEWFHGQPKELLAVRIFKSSNYHIADSKLLNASKEQWENYAHLYWQGSFTNEPFLEVIVHGKVFFPGWQDAPFGLLRL